MKRKFFLTWAGSLFLVSMLLFLSACGGQGGETTAPGGGAPANGGASADNNASANNSDSAKEPERLNYATSPIGTSVNAIGNGVASVISKNSDVKISVQPYAGMNAWLPLLNSGQAHLGADAAPEMVWAFNGVKELGYDKPINEMRLMLRGNYISATGLVVRKDSGIKSVADLKGKRVATNYPGTAFARVLTEAVLVANGLTLDDVKSVPVTTIIAGVEALRDNRVDATFALVPSSPIMLETDSTVDLYALHFLDNTSPDQINQVPQNIVNEITSRIPSAQLTTVAPQGYVDHETIAVKYPNYMVTSTFVSDETVYKMMETLWTHYEELFPVHPWLKEWTPEQMFDPDPKLPYHPGAVKFFKDKGLWNDQLENIQQQLLKKASK